MSSTETAYQRGQTFCRPADWIDVVQFFFLNYGLHALTVVTDPGSTPLACILASAVAIFMPSAGIGSAFKVLGSYAAGGKTDLEVALRMGALCTVVPSNPTIFDEDYIRDGPMGSFLPIVPLMTQVHGQYPADIKLPFEPQSKGSEEGQLPDQSSETYSLVQVPRNFSVRPLVPLVEPQEREGNWMKRILRKVTRPFREMFAKPKQGQSTKPNLACNYSFVKTSAAILQILYGSFELYRACGDQLEKYGYAAYSLTVIPYILMSLANLLASLSAPRYPSMFIVYYRGLKAPPQKPPTTPESSTPIEPHTFRETFLGNKQSPETQHIAIETIGEKAESKENAADGEIEEYPNGWWGENKRKEVEGKISGVVGNVYGDFIQSPIEHIGRRGTGHLVWSLVVTILSLSILAAPYVMIQLLTGFKKGQSTRSQRSWIMCWIVIGQFGAGFASIVMEENKLLRRLTAQRSKRFYFTQAVITVLLSVATFGGFVVVAQMMLKDQICRRL